MKIAWQNLLKMDISISRDPAIPLLDTQQIYEHTQAKHTHKTVHSNIISKITRSCLVISSCWKLFPLLQSATVVSGFSPNIRACSPYKGRKLRCKYFPIPHALPEIIPQSKINHLSQPKIISPFHEAFLLAQSDLSLDITVLLCISSLLALCDLGVSLLLPGRFYLWL